MTHRLFSIAALAFLITGCAQVPPSSVTLSNSITKDIESMRRAHNDFVNEYFDDLERRANSFIDNKYRPALIRKVIEKDVAKFRTPGQKHQSVFKAIQTAFVDNQGMSESELENAQSAAMQGIKIFYTKIDRKVETERSKLIDPIDQQRRALLANINNNYSNMINKNSAVTALLSSITDVHETQQQLLSMAGVEDDLREQAGGKLALLANKIEELQDETDSGAGKVEDFEKSIADLQAAMGD